MGPPKPTCPALLLASCLPFFFFWPARFRTSRQVYLRSEPCSWDACIHPHSNHEASRNTSIRLRTQLLAQCSFPGAGKGRGQCECLYKPVPDRTKIEEAPQHRSSLLESFTGKMVNATCSKTRTYVGQKHPVRSCKKSHYTKGVSCYCRSIKGVSTRPQCQYQIILEELQASNRRKNAKNSGRDQLANYMKPPLCDAGNLKVSKV